MTVEVALLVSFVSVAFSVYFGLKNSRRTDTKDIEERVKENTLINVKLDNIDQATKDIRADIAEVRSEIQKHNDRLIKVEESVKSAHRRIDTIEHRMNGGVVHERENKETD